MAMRSIDISTDVDTILLMQFRTPSLLLQVKALGDPVRLRILESLPDSENDRQACNVSQLAQALELPQPTVSHHLAVLRNAGLVRYKKSCRDVYYWTDSESFESAIEGLQSIFKKDGR